MLIINVTTETPGKRKGYYIRYPDGIISTLEGNASGGWLDAGIPIVQWAQHGSRFDALVEYSTNKQAAMKRLATPAT